MRVKDIIAQAPDSPGVYLMKDGTGEVIYIGKAKSLKKRLASYLGHDLAAKTMAMMSHVVDIEFQLCPSESMALLLEAGLIRKNKPKYNVSLRDDKSFPMVKITDEEFPALCITRKREDDGGRYFGPYTSAGLLREALKVIRRQFPYRSCKQLPKRPCMYYRIGLSPAPCIGKISRQGYADTIERIVMILEGKTDEAIRSLSAAMAKSSKELKFEEAAKIRDQIDALSALGRPDAGGSRKNELEDLKKLAKLDTLAQRIEAFDISNISGKEATGSMVAFQNGLPDKNNYRRFRIKSVHGIDDYSMLKEVIRRRYSRVIKEKLPVPDLVIIDGGKGHLLAAEQEVKKLTLKMPIISIAKEKEHIYIQGQPEAIQLSEDTPALNLIRRVRDEAHRFALKYHHVLHRKKMLGQQ